MCDMDTNTAKNRNTAVYRVVREAADLRGWASHGRIARETRVDGSTLKRWSNGGGDKTSWFSKFEKAAGIPIGILNKVYEGRMTVSNAIEAIHQHENPTPAPADDPDDGNESDIASLEFRLEHLESTVVSVRRQVSLLLDQFDELKEQLALGRHGQGDQDLQ